MDPSEAKVIEIIEQIPEFTQIHPNSILERITSLKDDTRQLIRCTSTLENGKQEVSFYTNDSWEEYQKELKYPKRHIQSPFRIGVISSEEREELSQFIEEESPKYFDEHKEKDILVKVVTGMIKCEDNYCSDEYDLFYRATFIPLIDKNKSYTLHIETGFDIHYERKTFICSLYNRNVIVQDDFRMVNCPYEYEIYKNKLYYYNKETMLYAKDSMPWIRFPRTKDGVSIPLLLDRVLQGNFDTIYFHK